MNEWIGQWHLCIGTTRRPKHENCQQASGQELLSQSLCLILDTKISKKNHAKNDLTLAAQRWREISCTSLRAELSNEYQTLGICWWMRTTVISTHETEPLLRQQGAVQLRSMLEFNKYWYILAVFSFFLSLIFWIHNTRVWSTFTDSPTSCRMTSVRGLSAVM